MFRTLCFTATVCCGAFVLADLVWAEPMPPGKSSPKVSPMPKKDMPSVVDKVHIPDSAKKIDVKPVDPKIVIKPVDPKVVIKGVDKLPASPAIKLSTTVKFDA